MSFAGFSEEDLKRMKLEETGAVNRLDDTTPAASNIRKSKLFASKPKKTTLQYKIDILKKQNSDDAIDNIEFDKCKLSIKTPTAIVAEIIHNNESVCKEQDDPVNEKSTEANDDDDDSKYISDAIENAKTSMENRKNSSDTQPDLVRSIDNYDEDELASHKAKLGELQLKQKLMEEQNKKRKEMLAKALADRTKQTEEEVMKLEKIKKQLQVLDGQFSQDVAMLRKKIDQACQTYADAEKHYLKAEKEFLQAKINLQKEKEKKELLTEHLCALITHNETRKAQKLETLMLELANDRKVDVDKVLTDDEVEPVIVNGVDQRTGKIVEFNVES